MVKVVKITVKSHKVLYTNLGNNNKRHSFILSKVFNRENNVQKYQSFLIKCPHKIQFLNLVKVSGSGKSTQVKLEFIMMLRMIKTQA